MSWREAIARPAARPAAESAAALRGRAGRRAVLAGLAAAVLGSGCGFRPLYGSGGAAGDVAEQLAKVEVGIIPDRTGQILRNYLIERINPRGRPTHPRYRLAVAVQETRQDLGIQRDATATRYNLIVSATYSLTDRQRNGPVLAESARTVTSYDYLTDQFATLTAETSARDRALRQLAEEICTRLALFMDREGEPS